MSLNIKRKISTGYLLALGAVLSLSACGDNVRSSAQSLTDAIDLIEAGVETTGTGLSGGAANLLVQNKGLFSSSLIKPLTTFSITAANCDVHGMPQESNGMSISQSDERYPYVHTYCAMTVADGDTVMGGFGLTRSLICTLEKGGIEFAGATQSITPNFSDTECWPNGGPGGDETPDGIVLSAIGSSPASFNSYFDKGVIFTVDQIGLTYRIAANLDGDKIEFVGHEDWTTGNAGAMAGELNQSTGILKFEKRDERIRDTCVDDSSCGWNRHTRLLATLTMSGGEPSDLQSFEYAYSDTNVDKVHESSGSHGGRFITAKGSLDGEIKAKIATATETDAANLKNPSNWTAGSSTNCYSSGVINDSADCSSEEGISMFTNSKFLLYSTPAHTSPEAWTEGFSGFNFSHIDPDVDDAY